MKIIALDLDDTLCDLKTPMNVVLNDFTKKDIHWNDWYKFDIIALYQMELQHFFDCIVENKLLENLLPYPETKAFLTKLKTEGYTIVIITSRDYHPDAYNLTKNWFDKYDLPYDKICITKHGTEKAEYIKEYEVVHMALDDRIENCESFMNSGKVKHTFLYDMPWNKNSDIPRIFNLSEAIHLL